MSNELPERYTDGIPKAYEQGHIVQHSVMEDTFSHLDGLTPANSRYLSPSIVHILEVWRDVENILETGPGLGVGASHLKYLAPQANLATAGGLTPINPYLRFAPEVFQDAEVSSFAEWLKKNVRSRQESAELSLDDILQIQRDAHLKIFEFLGHANPYIEKQVVSPLPDAYEEIEDGTQDLIYESYGPHWHTPWQSQKRQAMFQHTYDLLNEKGVMFIEGRGLYYLSDRQRKNDKPIVVDGRAGTLVAKRGNPHAKEFEKMAKAA